MNWFAQLGWAPAGVIVMLVLLAVCFLAIAVDIWWMRRQDAKHFRMTGQFQVGRDVK